MAASLPSTVPTEIRSTTITLTQKPGYYSLTASFARVVGQYQGDDDTRQFSLNKK